MADTLEEIFGPPATTKIPAARPPLNEIFSGPGAGLAVTDPAGAGQGVLGQLQGRDPTVDYTKGAPVDVRYNMSRASKGPEEEMYLRNRYGSEGFKQDKAGNWLVKEGEGFVPVYPHGVLEAAKSGGAHLAASAPQTGGAILGSLPGVLTANPPLAIGGAMVGAGGATTIDELIKQIQGFGNKSPGEIATRAGEEAALAGGFQAAGPIKNAVMPKVYDVTSRALRSVGGITPESRAVTQSLERLGVNPPIQSTAPGMKTFEYDRRLRNMIMKDPMQEARIGAMDTRMREVLEGFGIVGPELDTALKQVLDKTTSLSGRQTGEAVSSALGRRETGLLTEEATHRQAAETALQAAYDTTRNLSRRDVGSLGSNVSRVFEHERDVFNQQMGEAYGAITRLTGGEPIVNTTQVSRAAQRLLDTMDPQAVPPIIARLATGEEQQITFEAAHNLRTTLREMAKIKDLSPIGQRRGNIREMATMVDEAIQNAGGQAGPQAAQMLREADRAYAQGIVRFTNAETNSLIQDVRAGRMPRAEEVADVLVDAKSPEATRQMWSLLSPQLQNDVRTVDLKNLIDAASVTGKDGRMTLNPDALLKALAEREEVNGFVYPRQFIAHLREMATDFKALGGSIDVTGLPANQIRQHIERALGARRALEEDAKANPRLALRSNNPEMVDAGARYFAMPGHEARTLAGVNVLGANSPEWQAVQRFAVMDLLKQAVVPKGLGRTISGDAIEAHIGQLTETQQRVLFGNRLDDIRLIAKQAKSLFPELEGEFGGSLAAANIKGQLPKRSAIRAFGWSWMAGKLADSPTLTRMLVGQIQQNPAQARSIMSYLIQEGVDTAINVAAKNVGPAQDFSAGSAQPTLKMPPPVAQPRAQQPTGYGGPQ